MEELYYFCASLYVIFRCAQNDNHRIVIPAQKESHQQQSTLYVISPFGRNDSYRVVIPTEEKSHHLCASLYMFFAALKMTIIALSFRRRRNRITENLSSLYNATCLSMTD